MYIAHVAKNFVYIKLLNDYNEKINPKYNQMLTLVMLYFQLYLFNDLPIFERYVH